VANRRGIRAGGGVSRLPAVREGPGSGTLRFKTCRSSRWFAIKSGEGGQAGSGNRRGALAAKLITLGIVIAVGDLAGDGDGAGLQGP